MRRAARRSLGLVAVLLALSVRGLGLEVLKGQAGQAEADPRTAYDVQEYRLDLLVDPKEQVLHGVATLEAEATEALPLLVLDSHPRLRIRGVSRVRTDLSAEFLDRVEPLPWQQVGHQLHIRFEPPLPAGEVFRVAVEYSGRPIVQDDFTGFHFSRTPDRQPWIASSCQTIGSHTWWPCKSSFFHPEDKCERVHVNVTVPEGLVAAANGRLQDKTTEGPLVTWRWRHDYALPTYAVAVAIGPYEILEDEFELPGCPDPVPVQYFVLPQDVEKARLEFAVAEELLRFYGSLFGPYPFPDSKYGIAQTPIWGMEHSTVIAYGNSFPTWLAQNGGEDLFAVRNRLYDYILVHETAHEWWGNAITAASWGDFWLHEGFATYAEALWVEKQYGREAYLQFVQDSKRGISSTDTLYRPRHDSAKDAYTEILYDKGSYVLHMLRYVMRDTGASTEAEADAPFFAALLEFGSSPRFRGGTARTRDFQQICERHCGRKLRSFFQPWLYGAGWPHYTVQQKEPADGSITVEVSVTAPSLFPFTMPLDVELHCEGGSVHRQRHELGPTGGRLVLKAPAPILRVEYPGFRWILCDVEFLP